MRGKDTGIEVIPTCVDLDRFKPAKSPNPELVHKYGLEGKAILVYSGSLSTWYMPDEMLEFFRIAGLHIPQLHFLILTKEPDFLQKKLAAWPHKERGCITVENADYSLMSQYLSSCNAGIAFYKDGFSRRACCPTKFGEYLACGLPVIMNAGVGDTEKVIRDEGVGIIIKDFSRPSYEGASRQLNELLKEGEGLKERCVKAAAKYFSLEEGIESYSRVYGDLCAE